MRYAKQGKGTHTRTLRTVKPELAIVDTIAAHLVPHVLYPHARHYGHVLRMREHSFISGYSGFAQESSLGTMAELEGNPSCAPHLLLFAQDGWVITVHLALVITLGNLEDVIIWFMIQM